MTLFKTRASIIAFVLGVCATPPLLASQGRGGGSTPPPPPPAPVTVVNPSAADCYSGAGCLDPAFGSLGRAQHDVGGDIQNMEAVAIQADGKIVAAGTRRVNASPSDYSWVIGRFLPDGSVDATFGTDGLTVVDLIAGDSLEFVVGLAVQPDGKIVAAGSASIGGSSPSAVAIRLTSAGGLDPTFGTGGKATISSTSVTSGGLVLQSDGRLVVAFSAGTTTTVARLLANGGIDKKFGTQGFRAISGLSAHAVALQSTGRIVIAGGKNSDGHVTRLTTSGSVDTSFGSSGSTAVDFAGGQSDTFLSLSIASDDSIAAGGLTHPGTLPTFNGAIAHLTANGALNTGFGSVGRVILDMHNGWDHIRAVNLRTDGGIEFAGFSGSSTTVGFPVNVVVGRLTSTGALDSSFGAGGVTETVTGIISSQAMALAIGPDGLLTVAGQAFNVTKDAPDRWLLSRYFR